MVWKVAGLFVNPKYITNGSKRPRFVRNTAFHSSPSLIRTLLYPHTELGKVTGSAQTIYEIINQRERVSVLYRDFVQASIVLHKTEATILLFYKEDWSSEW